MGKPLEEFTPIEQVCWLAYHDGGRVDLTRPRSPRSKAKIDEALQAGVIDGAGWLTTTGERIALEVGE